MTAPPRAGLYLRLSRDDEGAGESASIATQRAILRAYAADHGFTVVGEYVDDGWSGTTFDRPGFRRLLSDIDRGRIDLVLTKDLSRLGRDYIAVGRYTEIEFPARGVRYIAVNDGYDSAAPASDLIPFQNVVNEMYARDASRKIRSAFAAKMKAGRYIGSFAPYGYRKDPADRNRLLPDEGAAPVIRRIFRLAAAGTGCAAIARLLNAEGVPSPALYRCLCHPHLNPEDYTRGRVWTPSGVARLLRSPVYLGHTVQGKTTKLSFKSPVVRPNPREAWIKVEHTHQPLVDEETFTQAARLAAQRSCPPNAGFHNLFSGLARCAGCGRTLSAVGTRKKGSPATLVCGGYKAGGKGVCTNHAIDYNLLSALVLRSLRRALALPPEELEALAAEAEEILARREKARSEDEGRPLLARAEELEGLLDRLWEEHLRGVLPEERLRRLREKYEGELSALRARLAVLDSAPSLGSVPPGRAAELVRRFAVPDALTGELLFRFVADIRVEQGRRVPGARGLCREQTVRIRFRFQLPPQTWVCRA